jgi:hypothetical protein
LPVTFAAAATIRELSTKREAYLGNLEISTPFLRLPLQTSGVPFNAVARAMLIYMRFL